MFYAADRKKLILKIALLSALDQKTVIITTKSYNPSKHLSEHLYYLRYAEHPVKNRTSHTIYFFLMTRYFNIYYLFFYVIFEFSLNFSWSILNFVTIGM